MDRERDAQARPGSTQPKRAVGTTAETSPGPAGPAPTGAGTVAGTGTPATATGAGAARTAADERPTGVTGAALLLATVGVVSLLLGVATFLIGNAVGNLGALDAATRSGLAGGATVTGVFFLALGAVQLAGAVLSWTGRQPGRILGIVGSGLGLVIALLSLLGALAGPQPVPGVMANPADQAIHLVISVVLLLAYALCLYAFVVHGAWFRGDRAAATG